MKRQLLLEPHVIKSLNESRSPVCFPLLGAPTCHHPPSLSPSIVDERLTPTFTHMLFGFLNELIVVLVRSTCCRVAWSTPSCCQTDCLHEAWLHAPLPALAPSLMLPSFLVYMLFISFFPTSHYSPPPPYFHQCGCFFCLPFFLPTLSLFLSLFVPHSQWECVTAAALPVQADSDWFSGASCPGPCWAERA